MNPTILLDRKEVAVRYEPDALTTGMDEFHVAPLSHPCAWLWADNISAETFAARVKSANRVFGEVRR